MHRPLAILSVLALAACGADAAPSATPSTPAATASVVETVATTDTITGTSAPVESVESTAAADQVAATETEKKTPSSIQPLPDIAVVSTDGRVTVAHGGAFTAPARGLIAADDRTLISTVVSADHATTTVRWTALADGAVEDEVDLDGDLTAVATGPTAQIVALTGAAAGGTEIVIAARDGERFRHSYTSELLPEGFSDIFVDSSDVPAGLFVIEYLDPPPAEANAPRRYRVRVVDTTSGDLALPLNLRNKGETVDEEMLGFGRTHVLSPLNGLLFTLYRGLDEDEAGYAFVHTLGFVNGVWCLDLPLDLNLGELPGSVVLADRESNLFVASANGYMTEFVVNDIQNGEDEPHPSRTASVWTAPGNTAGPALASSDAGLLVGQGADLRWIDEASLKVTSTLSWDMSIEAVALLPDGTALAAGTRRVSAITPTGDLVGESYLPEGFGTVARIVVLGGT